MLASLRSCFLISLVLAFSSASCLPVSGQINGVPASVTSYGFGGSDNPSPGIRASVTSLGPNGYGNSRLVFGSCCADFFWSANQSPPLFSGLHRRREDHNRGYLPLFVSEPVYIPYAVPYDDETDDDSSDADYFHALGPRKPHSPAKKAKDDHAASPKADPSGQPDPVPPEDAVAAQPSTVLVFKDGHKSDVVNYAIVGDTLFDFSPGRTHKILLADLDLPATQKANEQRGVDFQVPPTTAR